MDSFTEWFDELPDERRQALMDLSIEYAQVVLDTMPQGDRWLLTRSLAVIFATFYGEALGVCEGLPVEPRRVAPWSA